MKEYPNLNIYEKLMFIDLKSKLVEEVVKSNTILNIFCVILQVILCIVCGVANNTVIQKMTSFGSVLILCVIILNCAFESNSIKK